MSSSRFFLVCGKISGLLTLSLFIGFQSLATIDKVPGEPGEPGRADGTGGRGGRGGNSSVSANINGEDLVPMPPGMRAPPRADGNRIIINGVEMTSGQPGQSGAAGGAGGAGGTVRYSEVQRPKLAVVLATSQQHKSALLLDFACSEGTNYTVFVDFDSTLKADDRKTDLMKLLAFCPDTKKMDLGSVSIQDVNACKQTKITDEHKFCAGEFADLNKSKMDSRKQKFVNADIQHGRAVLGEEDVAGLDAKCGVHFGTGAVLRGTGCERQTKIALPTKARQYSCLVEHVRTVGLRNSTPAQLACYRNVAKALFTKSAVASTVKSVPAAIRSGTVTQ